MPNERVLVVEDDSAVREVICRYLQQKRYFVLETGTCLGAEELWKTGPEVAVMDYSLPDGNVLDLLPRLKALDPLIPVIILTAHGSINLAVEAIKLGADHFLTKPTELSALELVIRRSVESRRNRQSQLVDKNRSRREIIDPFLGRSPIIRDLAGTAKRIADSGRPVLIQGETGTGKGVLARWIHHHSSRSAEPFVDMNCGSFTRELLESELFGYERGAFTGAIQAKPGLIEIANHGSVFLDEIADADLQVQPKLLTVLEEKKFRRLGDVRERRVDIRLIAATHQDMAKLVRERRFRGDLFFRISTIPLTTPPLRERVEDIPLLSNDLLERLKTDIGVGRIELGAGVMRALQAYTWPGNIRELRNVLERAVLLSGSRVLSERDLHFDAFAEAASVATGTHRTLGEMERDYIEQILSQERGRVEVAARKLGIPRSSLYEKIKRYGIIRPSQFYRSIPSHEHN